MKHPGTLNDKSWKVAVCCSKVLHFLNCLLCRIELIKLYNPPHDTNRDSFWRTHPCLRSSGCCSFNIPSFTEPLFCMFSTSPPGGCTKMPTTLICKGSSLQVCLGVKLWHQHRKRVDFRNRRSKNIIAHGKSKQ